MYYINTVVSGGNKGKVIKKIQKQPKTRWAEI